MTKKDKYCYDYPRHAVASDIIVLTKRNKKLHILLIKRKNYPFAGEYAFPGGFVDPDETTDNAASRELNEETSIVSSALKQFRTYSNPGRDPRGRVISVIYYLFINDLKKFKAGDDAAEAVLFDIDNLPKLAFDHEKILADFLFSNVLNND